MMRELDVTMRLAMAGLRAGVAVVGVALVLVGASCPAAAAPLSRYDQLRVLASDFAQCLVDSRSMRAVDYLNTAPQSQAARFSIVRMVKYDCPNVGAVDFNDDELRGAMYAARYRRDFGGGVPALSAAAINYRAELPGSVGPVEANSYVALHEFGECVVRSDPAAARALVLSRPATDAERAAFGALAPKLGACLSTGNDVRFTKLILANIVAETMYRLSAAAVAPSGAH